MIFLVAIHKEPQSSYGVSVPDLPGCISAGDTVAEALMLAKEAIELHLEGMLDDDVELPEPSMDLDRLRADPDFSDAIWAVVKIDLDWHRRKDSAAA